MGICSSLPAGWKRWWRKSADVPRRRGRRTHSLRNAPGCGRKSTPEHGRAAPESAAGGKASRGGAARVAVPPCARPAPGIPEGTARKKARNFERTLRPHTPAGAGRRRPGPGNRRFCAGSRPENPAKGSRAGESFSPAGGRSFRAGRGATPGSFAERCKG